MTKKPQTSKEKSQREADDAFHITTQRIIILVLLFLFMTAPVEEMSQPAALIGAFATFCAALAVAIRRMRIREHTGDGKS